MQINMVINGSFSKALPIVEGEGKNGFWRRGGFVIVCGEEIERNVAFSFRKEEMFEQVGALKAGQNVRVSFVPESKSFEKDGKVSWITELRAFRVEA